jgi:hypothetical protein
MGNRINHIRTGKQVPCAVCGTLIYRKGYLLRKFKVFYCSRNCKGKTTYVTKKGIPRHWLDGERNSSWKGDEVGYQALHDWIRLHYGKAYKCEVNILHKSPRYHWANISKKYKRDITDWKQMCTSCNLRDR